MKGKPILFKLETKNRKIHQSILRAKQMALKLQSRL